MKTNINYLVIGIVSLFAMVGCGKLKPAEKLEAAVGVYQSTSELMKAAQVPYFVVTPDKGLYTLQKEGYGTNAAFVRNYLGDVKRADYSFNGTQFSSGNVVGDKISGSESLPEPINTLKAIVERGQALRKALTASEIDLEVRLSQRTVSFSPSQIAILDLLLADTAKLVTTLKAKNLKALWVNDYANNQFYVEDGSLRLPAGIVIPATEAITQAFR